MLSDKSDFSSKLDDNKINLETMRIHGLRIQVVKFVHLVDLIRFRIQFLIYIDIQLINLGQVMNIDR